nr:MAG TPA: hypothetical protein [Caudoviricetes sp.]
METTVALSPRCESARLQISTTENMDLVRYMFCQCMHHRAENVIFRALRFRQFVVWHEAGMLLFIGVFHFPKCPALSCFLFEPVFMTAFRRRFRVCEVVFHAIHSAVFLPVGCVFPCGLAVVAYGLAIRAVDFMGYTGDVLFFHGFLLNESPHYAGLMCCRMASSIR